MALLLAAAIIRLFPWAWELVDHPLGTGQLLLLFGFVVFMAYSEGYRGFQKAFAPRVAARALHLRRHPQGLRLLLAPFFCMAFFAAPTKRKCVSWILTLGVIGLVVLVRLLPQPYRGIIDAGVVVGLSWGLVALLYYSHQALMRGRVQADPEVLG